MEEVFQTGAHTIYHIWLEGKEEIKTTAYHPIYVEERGWVTAINLREGDPVPVYNLHVKDWVSYFVSGMGIYVHNGIEFHNLGGLNSINNLDDLLIEPNKLAGVSGNELYDYLIKNGYDVKPLSKGSYKRIPFEKGGGFKVNWGEDRLLQYHPESLSHHGGEYYKISSGKTGTIRIDLNGNLI